MPKLSEIFSPSYGNKFDLNKMKRSNVEQGVAFVGRSRKNLGVVAWVERLPNVQPYPAGCLTVALGGNALETFVQPRPFYTAQNVAVLVPPSDMTEQEKLYYCLCIRHNRHRYYGFGREANRTFREIDVPARNSLPEWVVKQVLPSAVSDEPQDNTATPDLDVAQWKYVPLERLFEIKKGKRLTKNQMRPGNTPFIGAIDHNNGLTARIDRNPIHSGNTITVNYNGNGVAEAFYQPVPFWCSDDVNVLYPKFNMDIEIALFFCTLIRKEKYRFSYGRKWHLERMQLAQLKLPLDSSGCPDWSFIRMFMRSLRYSRHLSAKPEAASDIHLSSAA